MWCMCRQRIKGRKKKDENVISLLCKLMVWYNKPEMFSYASMLVSLLMPIYMRNMHVLNVDMFSNTLWIPPEPSLRAETITG